MIYETKNSLSRAFFSSCHYSWIYRIAGSGIRRDSGDQAWANLGVLFILKKYSFKEAALVSLVRILVIGFMFGNLFSILYSLAGAALSMTVMTLMLKKTSFSLIGVSVAGGVSHNIGQLVIAMLILHSSSVFLYAPALLVAGVAAGVVIGGLTSEILKRVHF